MCDRYEAWFKSYLNILNQRKILVGVPDTISSRVMEKDLSEAFNAGRKTVIEDLVKAEDKLKEAKSYDTRVRKQLRTELKASQDEILKLKSLLDRHAINY